MSSGNIAKIMYILFPDVPSGPDVPEQQDEEVAVRTALVHLVDEDVGHLGWHYLSNATWSITVPFVLCVVYSQG